MVIEQLNSGRNAWNSIITILGVKHVGFYVLTLEIYTVKNLTKSCNYSIHFLCFTIHCRAYNQTMDLHFFTVFGILIRCPEYNGKPNVAKIYRFDSRNISSVPRIVNSRFGVSNFLVKLLACRIFRTTEGFWIDNWFHFSLPRYYVLWKSIKIDFNCTFFLKYPPQSKFNVVSDGPHHRMKAVVKFMKRGSQFCSGK